MVLAAHIDDNVLGVDQAQVEKNNMFHYAMETKEDEESNQISEDPIGLIKRLKTLLQILQMSLNVINVSLWQRLKLTTI